MREEQDTLLGGAAFAQIAHGEDSTDRTVGFRIAGDHLDRDRTAVREKLRLEALELAVAGIVEDFPDRRADASCRARSARRACGCSR